MKSLDLTLRSGDVGFASQPEFVNLDLLKFSSRRVPLPMPYIVELQQVSPMTLAASVARVNHINVADVIKRRLAEVSMFIRAADVEQLGINVVFYDELEEDTRFFSVEGIPVLIGVQVYQAFRASTKIHLFTTPAGLTAHVVHLGPHADLPKAHLALRNWCGENGYGIVGPNWEVYRQAITTDTELQTDVYYLLKPPIVWTPLKLYDHSDHTE